MIRHWRLIAALLAVLVTAAGAGAGAGGRVTPVNTADVTGLGMSHGTITLAAVRAYAPGTSVSAPTVVVDGVTRGYLVVAPARRSGPLPVIVVLHGLNASATQEFERDEFAPLAEQGKAVLVYPEGYQESWNIPDAGCCGPSTAVGLDDVAFVNDVVTAVRRSLDPGSGQLYLVGFSNGGKLAYSVVCTHPTLFAAFAAVAAAPEEACTASSQPSVPMMMTIGSKDNEVTVLGQSLPPAQVLARTAAIWRTRDGCSKTAGTAGIGPATVTTYSDCGAGAQVRTVYYTGLIHLWPNAPTVGSMASGATLIWSFFSLHGAA